MFSSGSAGSGSPSEIFSPTTGSAGGISAVGCSSVSSCSGAVGGTGSRTKEKGQDLALWSVCLQMLQRSGKGQVAAR